jgi:hypothetical protein
LSIIRCANFSGIWQIASKNSVSEKEDFYTTALNIINELFEEWGTHDFRFMFLLRCRFERLAH